MKLTRKTNLGKCTVPVYDLTVLDNSNYQITTDNIIVHNSGKSFVSDQIFGVTQLFKTKTSFGPSGLKVVNSDSAFEKLLKDNGIDATQLAKIEKEEPELWDKIQKGDKSIRGKAKSITKLQQSFYEKGRLGMIIDGTGRDLSKIKKQKEHAESLGYDCYMIFVDTTLKVAQDRNKMRERVLPEETVVDLWKDVQKNKASFATLFSGNFVLVNNSSYNKPPIETKIQKAVDSFIRKPILNQIGKEWIETAKALKRNKLI